jgi:NAD(P)H dehydrogenase (quinone)
MSNEAPILVAGAAGRLGGVGRDVVDIVRQRDLPVRTLVLSEDDRAESLRATGAEVIFECEPTGG